MGRDFDVFLSYSHVDAEFTEVLRTALSGHGLNVWLDKDQIRPGDWFAEALEDGVRSSRTIAILISAHSLASGWVKEEYYRALGLCHSNASRLIPVVIDGSELPGFLSTRQYVDFRPPATYEDGLKRLLWGISGEKKELNRALDSPNIPTSTTRAERTLAVNRPRRWSYVSDVIGAVAIGAVVKFTFDHLEATKDVSLNYGELLFVIATTTGLIRAVRIAIRLLRRRSHQL